MHNDQPQVLTKLTSEFTQKMQAKLIQKSNEGWNGWHACPIQDLETGLQKAVANKDYVDVANYALLLSARE